MSILKRFKKTSEPEKTPTASPEQKADDLKIETFNDIPDMRTDNVLSTLNMEELYKTLLPEFSKIFEEKGVAKPEIKVVAVTIRMVLHNPDDPTGKEMIQAELAKYHKGLSSENLNRVAMPVMNTVLVPIPMVQEEKEHEYDPDDYDGISYQ